MLQSTAFWNASGAAHHEPSARGSPSPGVNEQKKHHTPM